MNLIGLHILRGDGIDESRLPLIMATPATRIVKSKASPWEVFLCPSYASNIAVYYRRRASQQGGE